MIYYVTYTPEGKILQSGGTDDPRTLGSTESLFVEVESMVEDPGKFYVDQNEVIPKSENPYDLSNFPLETEVLIDGEPYPGLQSPLSLEKEDPRDTYHITLRLFPYLDKEIEF